MTSGFDVLAALRQPLQAFLDPGERVFWLFLLTSLAMPWLLLGARAGTRALQEGLVRRRIWAHASSRADITLVFVKAVVAAALRIPWLAATTGAALWVGLSLHAWLGPAEGPAWGPTTIAVVYSVVLFVAWDLGRFVLHVLMHRVRILWAFHQVHHSAQVLTPLTLYRTHPVETVLYDLRGMITTAAVTGVFLYVFRGAAVELQLLGINAIGFLFNAAGSNLRHSHVWLRFGRVERWLLSPAQHQLHHADDEALQNSNYGTWLAVWDRLAASWRPAPALPPSRYGLCDANHRPDAVGSMLVGPLVDAGRQLLALVPRPAWPVAALVGLGLLPRASEAAPAPEPSAPVEDPQPPAEGDRPSDPEIEAPEGSQGPSGVDSTAPEDGAPSPADPGTTTPTDDSTDSVDPAAPAAPAAPTADPPSAAPTPTAGPPPEPDAPEPDAPEPDAPEPDAPEPDAPELTTEDPAAAADEDYDTRVLIIGGPDQRSRVTGSAHYIDEEVLERKENDDVHRVLREVPGVYVREEDGFGLRPNIGLRGASSDRSSKVTLMEDGILIGPASYSAPAAYYFPLTTRMVGVEVFKGPAAIRYGPNTIGGAINLVTRPIPSTMAGGIDAALGMRGYGKLHGHFGGTWGRWGVLLEGARVQSNGFKQLDGGGETGFDRNDFMLKGRYATDPNRRWYHQVDVKGGYGTESSYESYLGLTNADFDAAPYRRYVASRNDHMKWWRSQAEAGYLVARGSLFELQLRGYRHDFSRAWNKFNDFRGARIRDVLAAPDVGQTAVFYQVLTGQQDSLGPGQTLLIGTNDRRFAVSGGTAVAHFRPTLGPVEQDIEVGVRVHHDQIRRLHTEDGFLMVSGALVPEGTERATTAHNRGEALAGAFHVVDTLRWAWLTAVPGARVEVIRTEYADQLADTRSSAVNTVFIPGLGLHAQALRWLGVLAGVHSGFSPVAPGQPREVRPERSLNYELGVRVDHPTRRTHTRAEVIGFFSDYSNLTSACTLSAGCDDANLDRQYNAGRVYVWGVEALVSERVELPREHFVEASASYTYTGSSFRSTFASDAPQLGTVARGDELPYVPKHLAAVGVGGGGRMWGLSASSTIVGQMRDNPGQVRVPTHERIPRHYVFDLAAHFAPTDRARVYLTLNNFTNNVYIVSRRPYGARPGMPIQLMVGFKYQFG